MERVQFQQEQMLAELKDLVQKTLFTQAEIKQIMKKRTRFETALVRRIPKKSDFLRYAAYEMGLEQLRRKRAERLKIPPSAHSISDYSLVRRQFQIFERALKKFKSDVGLWVQYIQIAKREGARALVGRITARALQLHPNTPSLYILAASHELASHSPSSARSLLQRGLRLNADSVEMWREYVRMEMGFVEGMRRRWNILGIIPSDEMSTANKGKQASKDTDGDADADELGVSMEAKDTEELTVEEQAAERGGNAAKAARQAILDGAIVQSAMDSAAKALPRTDLFVALDTLIRTYPATKRLRSILLDHLYLLLQTTLPHDPRAIKLLATRKLGEITTDNTDQPEALLLVEALQHANEQLVSAVKASSTPGMDEVYVEFVETWCRHTSVDEHMVSFTEQSNPCINVTSQRQYLIASLHALARLPNASSRRRTGHIRILLAHPTTMPSTKTLKLARKYTAYSNSAEVWLARLDAEHACADNKGEIKSAWDAARKSIRVRLDTDVSDVQKVWIWGLEHWLAPDAEDAESVYEGLLKESMRESSLRIVHGTLLLRYASAVLYSSIKGTNANPSRRLKSIRHISNGYLPTAHVWSALFTLEAARSTNGNKGDSADSAVLEAVYEKWRGVDGVEAPLAWAGWLLDHGRGQEAMKTVMAAMSVLDSGERANLENRWKEKIDGIGGEGGDDDATDGET
ncbi:U3 small nucleolar RNA-associated protein 6-domain-containing protein [Hygrophoropsis aurantiaca]|uniref:U3 small nucleolar RNA-associated protein 6-domain-containing protein n=1 Tax=Hygrophoropsis aurantiaca TaxID=72124 RepID=A0ACB8A995_9AGAM|nr:U3 small nucleolar RNA-associated protein 6-domain-containing protein [Hygrophoropsis aurantiaca]